MYVQHHENGTSNFRRATTTLGKAVVRSWRERASEQASARARVRGRETVGGDERGRSPVDVTLDGALADGGRGEVLDGAAHAGHGGVPMRKGT